MNMSDGNRIKRKGARGVLASLCRNRAGNTAIMTSLAIVPILGLIGGGVDAARGYAVKSRLQHACDSGALAIRRVMTGSTPTTGNLNEGYKFFDFNFKDDLFGVDKAKVTRTYAAGTAAGSVSGTSHAEVKMSLMRIFGYDTVRVRANCEATISVPNTDVMLVLDTTGSMDSIPSGDSISRLASLKLAVKDFYAELGAGTSSGPGRVRYGFVPYSSTVNVGSIVKGLNQDYLLGEDVDDVAQYATRTPTTGIEHYINWWGAPTAHVYGTPSNGSMSFPSSYTNYPTTGTTTISGTAYTNRFTNITSSVCSGKAKPADTDAAVTGAVGPTFSSSVATYPSTTQTNYYNTTQTFNRTQYNYGWTRTSGSGSTAVGVCQFRRRTTSSPYTRTTSSTTTQDITWADRTVLTGWNYGVADVQLNDIVSDYSGANPGYWSGVFASGQSNAITHSNMYADDAPATVSWEGCIEEPLGDPTISSSTVGLAIPSNAYDMQIDLKPNTDAQRWRPYVPGFQYLLSGSGSSWYGDQYYPDNTDLSSCPAEASELQSYYGRASDFNSYVDSLVAEGFTYHDIGMVWGSRLLSPDGIMSGSNSDASAPGGFQIQRHLVFMTDGNMNAPSTNNSAWGFGSTQGRDGETSDDTTTRTANHVKRFEMICEAAKAKGFTIWVVVFDVTTVAPSLASCASDADHYAIANNSTTLRQKFSAIAETIGGLRLSK